MSKHVRFYSKQTERKVTDANFNKKSVINGCVNKIKYTDKNNAIHAGKKVLASGRRETKTMGAYKCKNCKGWHLTSKINTPLNQTKFVLITIATPDDLEQEQGCLQDLIERVLESLINHADISPAAQTA